MKANKHYRYMKLAFFMLPLFFSAYTPYAQVLTHIVVVEETKNYKAEKYKTLAGLAAVRAEKLDNKKWRVLLGNFKNQQEADSILKIVRFNGFKNATTQKINAAPAAGNRLRKHFDKVEGFQQNVSYKRMEGTMNQKNILVHLYFNNETLTGFYDDVANKAHKQFSYFGAKNLRGVALNPENKIKENPLGEKQEGYKIDFMVKEKNGQSLNFSISETYSTGSAMFDIASLYQKKTRKTATGEVGTDVYVEYPIIKRFENADIRQKFTIWAAPLGATNEKTLSTKVESILSNNLTQLAGDWLSETYETKILENSRYLLSLRINRERISEQVDIVLTHKSYNLKTGEELRLSEQLNVGYEKEIKNMILKKQNNVKPEWIADLMRNYYFTTLGVVFCYQNEALTEVLIPYADLKTFIKKESFLSSF